MVLYLVMNSNTTLAIFAILAAMALVGATVTYVIIPADAQGANSGPFGQCKQERFSDNACKKGNFP
jgi:hypothetical protein